MIVGQIASQTRHLVLITGLAALGCALSFYAGTRARPSPGLAQEAPSRHETSIAKPPVEPLSSAYPADLVRVIDGDTFEARVRIWPGLEVTTKVRLRGIDAPELHARCPAELTQAEAARDALGRLLTQGPISIRHVSLDKYAGRVLAQASTRLTADVSASLLASGLVRPYAGGRRDPWCEQRAASR